MKISWHKCDELQTLIKGLSFLSHLNPNESFYYDEPQNNANLTKHPYTFDDQRPFLLVNIGSGVSILHVQSETCYRRITGTRSETSRTVRIDSFRRDRLVSVVEHSSVSAVY